MTAILPTNLDSLSGTIRRICAQWIVPGHDREDLAQIARIHLHEVIHKYDPTRAGLKTWVSLELKRLFQQIKRRRSEAPFASLPHHVIETATPMWMEAVDPEEIAIEHITQDEIVDIAHLCCHTPSHRAVLEGYLAGETDLEIAARLSCTTQSVSNTRARLFARIRRTLEARGYSEN